VKLENLKSLNLSHNKLKRSKLMLDLSLVCEEGVAGGLPYSTSQLASLLLAEEETKRLQGKGDVSRKLQEAAAGASSESELSFSEADENLDETWVGVKKATGKERIVQATKQAVGKGKAQKRGSGCGGFVNKKEERSKMIGKLMYPSLTHLVSGINC